MLEIVLLYSEYQSSIFSPVCRLDKTVSRAGPHNMTSCSLHALVRGQPVNSVPKYHILEPTSPRSSVGRALGWYSEGRTQT